MWKVFGMLAGLLAGATVGHGRSPAELTPWVIGGFLLGALIDHRASGWPWTALLTIVSLAVILLLILLAQAVFGHPSPRPRSLLLANLVLVGMVLVATACAMAWRRLIWHEPPQPRRFLTVAIAVGTALSALLALVAPPPTPRSFVERFFGAQYEKRGAASWDVLIVGDTADPAMRAIAADSESGALPGLRRDVRVGAVTFEPDGEKRLWREIAPLTSDLERLRERLAGMPATGGEPAYGAYPQILRRILRDSSWRETANRVVVLPFRRLPTTEQLDSMAGRELQPTACRRNLPVLPPPMTVSDCALALGSDRRWLSTVMALQLMAPGISASTVGGSTRLVVASDDPDRDRRAHWRATLRTMRGVLVREGEHPLQALQKSAFEANSLPFEGLAWRYRPNLRFDGRENFGPWDVDAFLAQPGHTGCAGGDCQTELATGAGMLRGFDAVDLAGDARSGADLPRDLNRHDDGRVYFKATSDGSRLDLDYWWFQRFNVSPFATNAMCLAGLGIRDLTCFDHEGDWEGVTVTLQRGSDGEYAPASVMYAGHQWGTRYEWNDLAKHGVLRDGEEQHSPDGTHPTVFVAYGSHAAYATECSSGCRQPDFVRKLGRRLPDGGHDGGRPWAKNPDDRCRDEVRGSCLMPLPLSLDGSPASWNAFSGTWGRARCTVVLAVCLLSDGPRSPAFQRRYIHPERGTPTRLVDTRRPSRPAPR